MLNHVCLHVLEGQEMGNLEAQTFQESLCTVSVLP